MNAKLGSCVFALGLLGAAHAQTTPATPATPATTAPATPTLQQRVAQLTQQMGRQVGDVYFKVNAAALTKDVNAARQNCARWQADVKVFDPLFTPEVSGFLTPTNWAQNPKLFDWIVNLTQMATDLRLSVAVVCDATAPTRAELVSAYAVVSNTYALNRQMAFQLQVQPGRP